MDSEAPGNNGLKDQSAALLWITNNIRLFGGNEMSITLMGHGSGAISAGLHLTSGAWSSEYFHKAIIMSGSSMFDSAVRDAKSYSSSIDKIAAQFVCERNPTDQLVECLRNIPAQILINQDPTQDWGPIIDNGLSASEAFIADYPRNLVEKGNLKKTSLLIGFTDMEEALDMPMANVMENGVNDEMYQTLIEDMVLNDLNHMEINESCGSNSKLALDAVNFVYKPYPPVADAMALREKYIDFHTERKFAAPTIHLATHMSKKAETYVYRFDIKPRTPAAVKGIPEWVTVPHRFDLIFVWGFPYWSMLPDGAAWDSMDKRVADIIMTLWANFAKFTNPSQVGVYIKWDPFTVQNPGVLIIDRSFNMSDSSSMHYQGLQFWNSYYPEVLNIASQCCNVTSNGKDSLTSYYKTRMSMVFIFTISSLFICHAINFFT